MRLTRLEVHDFGPIRSAAIDFGPGLNVLYGRNDLGKSYLAHAIRAALLLPHTSTAHEEFVAWGTDATPRVTLSFQTGDGVSPEGSKRNTAPEGSKRNTAPEGSKRNTAPEGSERNTAPEGSERNTAPEGSERNTAPEGSKRNTYWRVSKAFGKTAGAAATLERSPNGEQWSLEAKGRDVDGQLRRLLEWGIPEPGGKGKRLPRGLPGSFLTQVLLAEQGNTLDVFSESLEGDPDESGKQLLGQALQALTQDPLFKSVLERSQSRVDEAFLPTGNKRRGRDDPFPKAREEIRLALEEHEVRKRQREETDRVYGQLQEATEARLRAQARLDDAQATLADVEHSWQAQKELRKIAAELAEAEAQIMKVTTAEAEATNLAATLAEQERQLIVAEESRARAERAAEAVRERRRQAEGKDGAQRRELERERLDKRRLELEAAERDTRARLEAGRKAGARAKTIAELTADVEKRQTALDAARAELAALVEKKTSLETERRLLTGVGALLRWRRAAAELEEATAARDQAAELRKQAQKLRKSVEVTRARLEQRKLPGANEVQALRGLARELEVARARRGVGLSVKLRLTSIVDLEVTRDGGAPETTPAALGDHYIESEREVTLDLGDLARIEVQAGAEETRKEARELERGWREDVVPVLEAAGVAGVAELEEACRAVEADRRRAEEQVAEADRLEAKAGDVAELASQVDVRAERAKERETAIEGYDRAALEKAAKLGEDAEAQLDGLERQNREALEKANARREEKQAEVARAEGDLRHSRRRIEDEQRQLEELAESWEKPWEEVLAAAETKLKQVAGELKEVTDRRDGLESAHGNQVAELRSGEEAAAKELEMTRAAVVRLTEERNRTQGALEAKRGQLQVLREHAEKVDMPSLRAAYGEAQKAAGDDDDDGGVHREPVSQERLTEARQAVEQARAALAEQSTEVDKLQGALEQVGGEVAVEREKEALDAWRLAKERERELDLEYGAWRLLVETLREAENEESSHLGRALVGPVSERFAELTEGRYGRIGLDPDLKTTGIDVAGNEREVAALSQGLKEQLATIFRISVAQHLESMVVLDDHLTHTDPARLGWFREVLRKSGEEVQIVVLTCRPGDYLGEGELVVEGKIVQDGSERLRGVALERVMERVGATA